MCSMGLGGWEGASALGNVWSHIGDKNQGDLIGEAQTSGGGWMHREVRRDGTDPGSH